VINKIAFFYRHTNPVFFSLERVFENIAKELQQRYSSAFAVEEVKMPFVSKPANILKNILFTAGRQAEINHVTGDVHYALLACRRKNINILTIHDCGALKRYRKTDPRYWIIKWLWFSWPVRKANMITVISENTKKELLDITNMDNQRIRVIPNFVDPDFCPVHKAFDRARPRVLFIGTTPNKNLERLAKALAGLTIILDIVGELDDNQLAVLKEENIVYELSSRLSRRQVVEKYQNCDLLAFPSTYEGFGLPVLEAQAIGRPVLTSHLSPIWEVSGGAACLVNPFDVASIREGILRILDDEDYRKEIVELGFTNVQRFRLDKVADQYVSLYRELLLEQ